MNLVILDECVFVVTFISIRFRIYLTVQHEELVLVGAFRNHTINLLSKRQMNRTVLKNGSQSSIYIWMYQNGEREID